MSSRADWRNFWGATANTGLAADADPYGRLPDLTLTAFLGIGGQLGFSGGNRPTGGFGSDGTGSGDKGDSYIAKIEMAPIARDAA